jgi:predicted outer membrane repeat protein
LINAINQANNSPEPAVINLGYCIYTLTDVHNTISLVGLDIHNGLPAITSEITIYGNSAVIRIEPASGEPDFGHFYVAGAGNLALYDLILQYGYRPMGGAVLNQGGDFFASGVDFLNNAAVRDGANIPALGGAIFSDGGRVRVTDNSNFMDNVAGHYTDGGGNLGGGIYIKNGSLSVIDSTFFSNSAYGDGGAIYSLKSGSYSGGGAITIEGTNFVENYALDLGGGIVLVNETGGVYLTNSVFEFNKSRDAGGALYSEDSDLSVVYTDFSSNSGHYGGAIYTKRSAEGVLSKTSIELSNLNSNSAEYKGGAIFSENSDLTVDNCTLYQNQARSCGGIQNGGEPEVDVGSNAFQTAPRISSISEIRTTTFSNNSATMAYDYDADGGGLCHVMGELLISGSVFQENIARDFGGGLMVVDELEMIDTLVDSNSASNGGGMAIGGALAIDETYPDFNVDITSSNFESNRAYSCSPTSCGFGGGLLISVRGTTTINKSTFFLNRSDLYGGGIYQRLGDLYLTNSTLSSNRGIGGGIFTTGGYGVNTGLNHVTVAFSNGGGIDMSGTVYLSVYKSLFHQNSQDGDVDLSAYAILSGAGNVIEDGPSALGTTFPAGSPMIGPLTGSTHPILPGSPLIDFLSSCGEPDDQRTVIRPQGAGCEPGAYEYNGEDDIQANIPDIPQLELDLDEPSDNCEPFAGLVSDVYTLGLPGETMNLPVVLRVDGEIPGWDPETMEVSPLYQFNATLGDLQSSNCSPQGYPDRLICMFHIPDHAPGMALDFALNWNDCDDPVFTYPLVSIPQPTTICHVDLEQEECEAVGGAYLDLDDPYCLCP